MTLPVLRRSVGSANQCIPTVILPLVVRVGDDGGTVDVHFGSILRLTQIEPSRVMVEHSVHQVGIFYMMRDSGYDRC